MWCWFWQWWRWCCWWWRILECKCWGGSGRVVCQALIIQSRDTHSMYDSTVWQCSHPDAHNVQKRKSRACSLWSTGTCAHWKCYKSYKSCYRLLEPLEPIHNHNKYYLAGACIDSDSDWSTLPLILSASKCFRFPSHFIRIQIFPSRLVGDKMNISQSTQKGKRDELNSFTYFTQVIGAQIFAKHQFQLSNLDFTMKSASLSKDILWIQK